MTKYGINRACIAIAVLFAVNIAVITLAQRADAASYKRGSTGSVVSEIQQKLKDRGYYSAEVDGGINTVTGPQWIEAGVDWLVAGNSLFRAEDPAAVVRVLHSK